MCYYTTQVAKAKDLGRQYKAIPSEITMDAEINLFKAVGFAHPELMIVLERKGERLIDLYQWGLMPTWNKPLVDMLKLAKGTLNARAEDVREKVSYKSAIKNQRCVIPVNSFFEYKHVFDEAGKKIDTLPYLIKPKEAPYFNLAGLYSFYKNPADGEWFKTFTIVTEPANVFMADIHNSAKRMPLMLSNDLLNDWINPNSPEGLVNEIMQYACDDSSMEAHRVRRDLKTAENEKSILLAIEK